MANGLKTLLSAKPAKRLLTQDQTKRRSSSDQLGRATSLERAKCNRKAKNNKNLRPVKSSCSVVASSVQVRVVAINKRAINVSGTVRHHHALPAHTSAKPNNHNKSERAPSNNGDTTWNVSRSVNGDSSMARKSAYLHKAPQSSGQI